MGKEGKYYWLKLYDNFFEDKFVKALIACPNGDTMCIVFIRLMLASLNTDGIIKYEGIYPSLEEEIALDISESVEVVRETLKTLDRLKLIERMDDSSIYMKTLKNHVGSETKSAERKRRQREKEKASNTTKCDDVTQERTLSHRDRDREDTDIDIETDTECRQNPPLQDRPNKKQFGPHKNVYLTDNEHKALAEKYPDELIAKLTHLSNYLYEHPEKERRYKCHYSKIIEWIEEDRIRNQQNLQSKMNQTNMSPQRQKEYEDMIADEERWLLEQGEKEA